VTEAMTLLFQFLKRVQFCAYLFKGAERDLEQATQERLLALSGVEKSRKAAIAHDEIMDILATGDPSLSSFQAAQEGFHLVVGTRQTGTFVAGEQAPPTVAKRLGDVGHHLLVPRIAASRLGGLKPIQVSLDLLSNDRATGGRLVRVE